MSRFVLALHDLGEAAGAFLLPRLQHSIGVVYRPQAERESHYLHTRLTDQLDAIAHVDQSLKFMPLDRTARWDKGEAPETCPTGL